MGCPHRWVLRPYRWDPLRLASTLAKVRLEVGQEGAVAADPCRQVSAGGAEAASTGPVLAACGGSAQGRVRGFGGRFTAALCVVQG